MADTSDLGPAPERAFVSAVQPRRCAALLLALVVVVVLTACSPGGGAGYTPPTAPPTSEPSINLPEAKQAAQIASCPVSGDEPAVAGGLPDLTLPCLGGGRTVRLAGLRGRPMLISVWAQWCPPCRAEAPHLSEVADLAGNKMVVLGVDYDDPQPGYAIEFAQLAGWHFPQLADKDRSLSKTLPFSGPPQMFLVDAHGKIVYHQSGQITSTDQLKNLIHDHLNVQL